MKIGIVGSGFVGATAAYALVMRGIGRQVVLIDIDQKRSLAEAEDIFHAVPFAHPVEVIAGDYADLLGCRVVLISAGVNQKAGETRLQLLNRNAAVFKKIVPQILAYAPEAILLVATNPVDIMTHLTAFYAGKFGISHTRVIGSGTTLDTARFRTLLGRKLGVDPHHVHAYVIGEHGDSEVLTWSLVTVGGMTLEEFCKEKGIILDDRSRQEIDEKVRRAAYHIIEGKGATYYGIGSALSRIVEVILHDQRAILTLCSLQDNVQGIRGVTLSLPHLLGGDGVLTTFPLPLNDSEATALRRSADIIRRAIAELNVDIC